MVAENEAGNHPNIASEGLATFRKNNPIPSIHTTSYGVPVWNRTSALTVGPRGPMLMQDAVYFDEMGHFDRERIPERVVHAKGGGAHGFFEVTHDITRYTKAKLFNSIGKCTPMFIRFSTVGGERGTPDTVRDPRGFAMKFYTEEGNWDLVGNNTPIFFIRDPFLFPSFIRTQKRNPQTNLKDPNAYWDFWSLRPESMHQVMFLFSDRGTPDGFRHMNGYGSHTFKLVNKENDAIYCKFHIKTDQGIRNLPSDRAQKLAGDEPDYAIRDLFNNIESGNYPQWTFFIQVMTFEEAAEHPFNPFDVTKVWSHKEFPLIPVGKIVLNKNPVNYFAEVEQAAFSPAHLVPGIEFSPDKMLQGRIFSYSDTQFHRLGPNYAKLPINCPYRVKIANDQADGLMALGDNQGNTPNYYPNSFNGPVEIKQLDSTKGEHVRDSQWVVEKSIVDRHDDANVQNYEQPRIFWEKVLDKGGRQRMVENIVGSLSLAMPEIQKNVIAEFNKVHSDFGEAVENLLKNE